MNIDMKNKKVIITGGSTGIGKEVVKVFAKNGAKVAIFDVNNEAGIDLTNELTKEGFDIRYWNVDVRDSNQVSGYGSDVPTRNSFAGTMRMSCQSSFGG